MKLFSKLSVVLVAALALMSSVGCTRIGPGHAGIVVNQAGNNRGVLNQTATTGWVFYNPLSQDVIEYQTSMRSVKWTADANEGKKNINEEITFTNQDQMVVATDIGISFSLDPNKVPAFYVKFLAKDEDDLDAKFTDSFLKNAVRNCMNDSAGKYSIAQIMGDNATFLKESHMCIQAAVSPYGVDIDQFGLLSAPRPPSSVISAINSKSQAEQITLQKKLEVQQVEADAAKSVAEAEGQAKSILTVATAQAQANQKLAASLSPTLIQHEAIQKWDGHRPQVEGHGGGLLLNVGGDK